MTPPTMRSGRAKAGDAPRTEPLAEVLERLRRQSDPEENQPLAAAGGQVITPYARPAEASNARTFARLRHENARTFTHLQYEVDVAVDSHDLVGKLNPRNGGLANHAAQSAKKFMQRSLSWYTRSLHHFQAAVSQALVHTQTLLRSHDETPGHEPPRADRHARGVGGVARGSAANFATASATGAGS